VLAIPGSIHSPMSKGCHALIKQGAKLVESVQDVLEELPWYGAAIGAIGAIAGGQAGVGVAADPASGSAATGGDALLQLMGFDPVTLDQLALRSGLGAAVLQGDLLMLELDGHVESLPGGVYRRMAI
jgi:DNA processing protein